MDYTTAKRIFQSLINKEVNPETKQLLRETFLSWTKEHHPLEYKLHLVKQSPGIPEGASLVKFKWVIPPEHKAKAIANGYPLNELKRFNLIKVSNPDWGRTYVEGSLEFETDTIDKWEYPDEVNEQYQMILTYQSDKPLSSFTE